MGKLEGGVVDGFIISETDAWNHTTTLIKEIHYTQIQHVNWQAWRLQAGGTAVGLGSDWTLPAALPLWLNFGRVDTTEKPAS
jgi:hypothetical protein